MSKTNRIKSFFRNCPLTRKAWIRLSDARLRRIKSRELMENGEDTVVKVQKILSDTGAFFFFDMGTLLGIVREGRLLKHDMDIDIGVMIKDEEERKKLRDALVSKGCTLRFNYSIEGFGTVESSFLSGGIKFDINYYRREDEYPDSDVCYLMYRDPDREYGADELSVVRLVSPHIGRVVKTEFAGAEICIPENAEEYLAARYGENWRVPDKGYVYWKGPSTSPTDYVGRVETVTEI